MADLTLTRPQYATNFYHSQFTSIHNGKRELTLTFINIHKRVIILFEMAPGVPVIFILIITSSAELQDEEPQTVHSMPFTWASHITGSVLAGC